MRGGGRHYETLVDTCLEGHARGRNAALVIAEGSSVCEAGGMEGGNGMISKTSTRFAPNQSMGGCATEALYCRLHQPPPPPRQFHLFGEIPR
jgi:hypothetical protein